MLMTEPAVSSRSNTVRQAVRGYLRRHQRLFLPRFLFRDVPRGTITDARAWVDERRAALPADVRRGADATYREVDPPETRVLPAPRTLPERNPGVVQRILPVDPTALFLVKGARIVGAEGVVISPDNRVFADFTYVDDGRFDRHSIFRRRRFPRVKDLPGWYGTITYPSSAAYFHWIVESLPRLRLLQPYLDALEGIFVPDGLEPAMRESLAVMGIRSAQVIPLGMMSHFRPEHLLVPRYCAGLAVPTWVPQYLRHSLLGSGSDGAPRHRVFISRSDAAKRRLLNEDALWPILAKLGFERVRLRDLSFTAQAALFDGAEIVIGPHGAGLANIAFCRPGTKVLELLPSDRTPPHVFYSLAGAAGVEYWCLQGDAHSGTANPSDDVHRDFNVDPDELAAVVAAMMGAGAGIAE